MNQLHFSLQPQPILAARFASFARERSFGYASLQELTNRTRQNDFRLTEWEVELVH